MLARRRERDELIPPSYLSFFHYTILFLLCYTYSQQMKIKVLYVPVTFIVLVYAAFSVYHIIQESNLLENERIRLRVCINIKQLYFQSIYLIYCIFILLFCFGLHLIFHHLHLTLSSYSNINNDNTSINI